MLPTFEYHRATTLHEALDLLDRYGSEAKLLAGGTDLIVKMRDGLIKPKHLIDISELGELKFIEEDKDTIRIGALTPLSEIETSPLVRRWAPVLCRAVEMMSCWHIKNSGTIGGNLCNASPAADTAPPLLVLGAELKIAGKDYERKVSIEEFFKGPGMTVMGLNELLTEIIVSKMREGAGTSFQKLSQREGALAIVSSCALAFLCDDRVEDVRIALGAVAPTPVRAKHAEEILRGKELSKALIREASKEVLKDISPITDVRGSKWYREEMSVVLTRRALLEAIEVARCSK
jgi:carbon-monoxide dehydrogenase medium subunit